MAIDKNSYYVGKFIPKFTLKVSSNGVSEVEIIFDCFCKSMILLKSLLRITFQAKNLLFQKNYNLYH